MFYCVGFGWIRFRENRMRSSRTGRYSYVYQGARAGTSELENCDTSILSQNEFVSFFDTIIIISQHQS